MQKSSTRFFIFSILVMAILVIVASSLVLNFSKEFKNDELNVANADVSSASFVDSVLAIGAANGSSGSTIITNDGRNVTIDNNVYETKTLRTWIGDSTSNSSAYLYESVTLTTGDFNSSTLRGTLDCRGNSINIATSSTTSMSVASGDYYAGGIAANLEGIIKNGTVNITSLNFDKNTNTTDQYWKFNCGALFGRVSGTSTIENLKVIYNNGDNDKYLFYASNYTRDTSGDHFVNVGILAGSFEGGSVNNVEIQVLKDVKVRTYTTYRSYIGIRRYAECSIHEGVVCGKISGTSSFYNIAITGGANITETESDTADRVKYRGAVLGAWVDSGASITVNGVFSS